MDEDNSQTMVRHSLREQEDLGLDWFNKLQRLKAGLEHRYKKSFIYPSQVRSGLKTWFEEVWDVERSSNIKLCFYNKYNIKIGRYGEKRNDVIHRVYDTCSHNNDDAVSLLTKLTFFDPIFRKTRFGDRGYQKAPGSRLYCGGLFGGGLYGGTLPT